MSALARLRATEPVRLFAYPALLALAVWLVGRGIVDAELADIITGAAALLLGVPLAEAARRKVTAPANLNGAIATGAVAVLDQLEDDVAQWYGEPGTAALRQIKDRVAELGDTGTPRGRHSAER